MKKRNIFKRAFTLLLSSALVFGGATEAIGEKEENTFNNNSNNLTQLDIPDDVVVLGEKNNTTILPKNNRESLTGFRESLKVNTNQPIQNQPIQNQPIQNQPIQKQPTQKQPTPNQPNEADNYIQTQTNKPVSSNTIDTPASNQNENIALEVKNENNNPPVTLNWSSNKDYYLSDYIANGIFAQLAQHFYGAHSSCEIGRQIASIKDIIDKNGKCTVIIDGREVNLIGYVFMPKPSELCIIRNSIPNGYSCDVVQTCWKDENGNDTNKQIDFYSEPNKAFEPEIVNEAITYKYGGDPTRAVIEHDSNGNTLRIIDNENNGQDPNNNYYNIDYTNDYTNDDTIDYPNDYPNDDTNDYTNNDFYGEL